MRLPESKFNNRLWWLRGRCATDQITLHKFSVFWVISFTSLLYKKRITCYKTSRAKRCLKYFLISLENMQSSTGMYNYSSSPSGITDPPSIVPVLMLCLLGVIGNSIAVTIVCCTARSHRWRPFHRYVCGLALTDGIGVMLALPFAIHRYTTNFQFTYSYTVCSYMSVVQMFTIIASAMIVCLMSIDRFMALICPYVYKSVKKGRHSTVTLACIWGVCAFLSSGHLMAGRSSRLFYPDSWCFVNFVSDNPTDLGFAFLYALTGLLVLVVTFITNMILLAIVLQRKCSKSSAIIANKHGTYIILFLFSIVLLFSICILPILVRSITLHV